MTDRELLEYAAKAAGLVVAGLADKMLVDPEHRAGGFIVETPTGGHTAWNPLTDDGDALRLAVKLRINIEHVSFMSGEKCEISCYPKGRGDCMAGERVSDDPQVICLPDDAAARRAITHAAAEIGKAMP